MGTLTNANSVSVSGKDLLDGQVSDDDVGLALDETASDKSVLILGFSASNLHAEANKDGKVVLSDDAGITTNGNLISSLGDGARDNNDLGSCCSLA